MSRYDVTTQDAKQQENNFTYHAPFGDQQERYIDLRDMARELAFAILRRVPPSRERSLAITKLEESIFWANAGIARNEKSDVMESPASESEE